LFPCFISDTGKNIQIRFDTNGFLFGDSGLCKQVGGRKEFADLFIDGLFKLKNEGNIKCLWFDIIFSLKGATPNEVYWTLKKRLPATKENNNTDFKIEEHPQYSPIKNLINAIKRNEKKFPDFKGLVHLSVEKGIMHDVNNKTYAYYKDALDYDKLEEKLGFKLSETQNCFNLFTGPTSKQVAWRYLKHSAKIIASFGNEKFEIVKKNNYFETMPEIEKFFAFCKLYKDKPDFKVEVTPIE